MQHHAVGGEAFTAHVEERPQILRADVFHHPDRGDAVECPAHVAIVELLDGHRQVGRPLAGDLHLLRSRADAGHLDAVALSGERGETTPAAADVEHSHPGLERELATDQVELRVLCCGEIVCFAPVAAAVDHPRVEHALVQVVADVVVRARIGRSTPEGLPVAHGRLGGQQDEVRPRAQGGAEIGQLDLDEELVHPVRIPPAVLIGLAEAEFPIPYDAAPQAVVVDVEIPWLGPADLHAGPGE